MFNLTAPSRISIVTKEVYEAADLLGVPQEFLSYQEAAAFLQQQPIDAVKRGAALLDRVSPGWYRRVNVDTLSMVDMEFCIAGQAFGLNDGNYGVASRYRDVMKGLDLNEDGEVLHGFSSKQSHWVLLEHLWNAEIEERKAL